jgi:hypothetical protein
VVEVGVGPGAVKLVSTVPGAGVTQPSLPSRRMAMPCSMLVDVARE